MSTMEDWLDAVRSELSVELDLNTSELLEVTKVVAHNVARPAAPLTAFLIGYAAAQAGGGPRSVSDTCASVTTLARRFASSSPAGE